MKFDVNVQTRKYSAGVNTCEYICLHHTGGSNFFGPQWKYIAYSTALVSCHYVVGQNGEVAKISNDDKITRHAGTSSYDGKRRLNNYSIGVEIVSKDGLTYTYKQRVAVRNLIEYLMVEHNIKAEDIIRHRDITIRKWDVGDKFWDNEYNTFNDYKFSFLNNEMTENEKKMLIESLMNLNSTMYNNVDDDEAKKLMSSLNSRFRYLGFDNN